MKAPETASASSTVTPPAGSDATTNLSDGPLRRRSVSLDTGDFPEIRRSRSDSNPSNTWFMSFTRRSSVDVMGTTVSPAGSMENLATAADECEPRSRHSSGDSLDIGGHHRIINRRKSEPSPWKLSGLFTIGGHDTIQNDHIPETDEKESSAWKESPAHMKKSAQTMHPSSSTGSTDGSYGIMKLARRMSARDLNALCPTGEM